MGCNKIRLFFFLVLVNHLDKIYVSWALSLNKCVRVSACKLHMPDTHVFVPTQPKSYQDDLPNKKLQLNFSRQGNSFPRFSTLWLLCLQVVFYFVQRFFRNLAYRVAFDGKIEINWRKWS